MKALFHPEAYEEMVESARFYEGRSEGFGSDFLAAIQRDRIFIAAIMHQQRRPGYWRKRLQK